MKKTVFLLFLFAAAQAALMAGTFNIDKNEEIDLSGVERISFVMEGPRCMMCLQTGSFEYSFSGRRSGGTLGLSLEGDLSSNRRRALPELITDKKGRTLTVKLYEKNHLFFGLVQNGSVHFHAEIPLDFDGEVEILTSSGDLTVEDLSARNIVIDSSSGDIEAGSIAGEQIEIEASSGRIRAETVRADEMFSIKASSGDIYLGETSSTDTRIEANSGRIELGRLFSSGTLSIEAHSGRITADTLEARRIDVESHSGRISIGAIASDSVEMKASSGSVDLGFSGLYGPVDIDSSSGDIVLHLPAASGFSADLEVSSGRIISDFKLLGDVSNSERDSVRGEANGGGPLLRLETSSGDIEIRKQ